MTKSRLLKKKSNNQTKSVLLIVFLLLSLISILVPGTYGKTLRQQLYPFWQTAHQDGLNAGVTGCAEKKGLCTMGWGLSKDQHHRALQDWAIGSCLSKNHVRVQQMAPRVVEEAYSDVGNYSTAVELLIRGWERQENPLQTFKTDGKAIPSYSAAKDMEYLTLSCSEVTLFWPIVSFCKKQQKMVQLPEPRWFP